MEAQALDRSKLEQKDRAELATIVEAMGGKATSRAKKADLVDQILQLAGVGDESPAAPAGGDADTGPSLPEPAVTIPDGAVGSDEEPLAEWELDDAGEADDAPAGGRGAAGGGGQGGTGRGAGGAGAGGQGRGRGAAGGAAGGQAQGAAAGRGQAQGGSAGGGHGGATGGGQGGGAGSAGGGQAGGGGQGAAGGAGATGSGQGGGGGQRNDGGQGQGGQGHGGSDGDGQGEDGEPGNRRRRRRGRDRGRDRDGDGGQGAQGGGQGQGGQGGGDEPAGDPVDVEGYLDLRDEGYGFLRVHGYLPSKDDVYVSVKQVRQLSLRKGDHVTGASRPAGRNEKNPALLRIDAVNGGDPEVARGRRRFDDLTPVFPDTRLGLEQEGAADPTARVVDLLAPIGKGQRGLVVAPPKSGRSTVLRHLAAAIEANHPDVHLIVLLIDERPEEVTAFRRALERAEVAASTFDRPAEEHTQVAELTVERAKRMVEDGRDVVVVLDGLTRLARAWNLAQPSSGGKVVAGGIDAAALHAPKKLFGAARNLEEGGSLTIVATVLADTGSRIDEAVYEELRDTATMELVLDRRLAEGRRFPAIDLAATGSRPEESLYDADQLEAAWALRRELAAAAAESGTVAALELLTEKLAAAPTNAALLGG